MQEVIAFIGGKRCLLRADNNVRYIKDVAKAADRIVRQVKEEEPQLAPERQLTLAVINAVDRQLQAEKNLHVLEQERQLTGRDEGRTSYLLKQAKDTIEALEEELQNYDARSRLLEAAVWPMSPSRNKRRFVYENRADSEPTDTESVDGRDDLQMRQLSFSELLESSKVAVS